MVKDVRKDLVRDAEQKHGNLSRRTFLSSTGTAALAVAATGLLSRNASGQAGDAPSTEQATPAASAETAKFSNKYPHLLAPLKIGRHVLKNRIIGTPCSPHFLDSPGAYPNEALIYHYAHKAKAGASIVVLSQELDVHPTLKAVGSVDRNVLNTGQWQTNQPKSETSADDYTLKTGFKASKEFTLQQGNFSKSVEIMDAGHYPIYDLADGACQNILSQLTQAVHFYDSLCLMKPKIEIPKGYDVSPGDPVGTPYSWGTMEPGADEGLKIATDRKEITEEMLQKTIIDAVIEAALAKDCGFDGFFLHCAYRAPLTARMLSPLTNRRTDKYGGSLENRARFIIELCDAIKKNCGRDFFIMIGMSGSEPKGGYTPEDTAEYAKLFTGHADMVDIKGDPGERMSAPSYFVEERTPYLYITEVMKKKGVTIPVSCDGGFQDLDDCEAAIASGKTDAVGVARGFITTPDFGTLAYEGRNEDVVPCLRCNGCHGWGFTKPWLSTCAVNPTWGLEHKIDRMISPPESKKKVAVIGGGPSGMEAAMIASRRGHDVTLYEKGGSLGGLFNTYGETSFKWTYKEYKNYLIRQVGKLGVKVRLNTEATPAMIQKEGFDAVIAAIGAEPIVPDVPGIKGKNVVFAPDVFGKEDTLAKDVAVIGGGLTGTETGMHLASKGHRVTVLEKSHFLAKDRFFIHFWSSVKLAWEQLPNFSYVLQARFNGVTKDGVTYIDASGKEQSLKAGSVVIAAGMKAKDDLAFSFHGAGRRFYMVGDCKEAGGIENAVRTAFNIASMI